MNYIEFMRLPLESRKRIESAILSLDKAVQAEYGFSMLKGDIETIKEVNAKPDSEPNNHNRE